MTMPNLQVESNSPIPAIDYYRIFRGQIEHEDNLNSQRLSWFVASQSFLFTAYAIVVTNLRSGGLPWVEGQERLLTQLIPVMALITCLLIYVTILAGAIAIANLRRFYHVHQLPQIDKLPPVQGYRLTQLFGQAGPLLLPPAFVIIWLILLARGWV